MAPGEPLVTVLVCTHDDEPTLPRALDSALAQTAPREAYRVLVVDDGSTDGTAALLRAYRGRGVEIVRLERNRGLPAACNAGLERIEMPFYVRLDADDAFEPELVEALLAEAERSGADLVYSDRWEVTPSGRRRLRELGGAFDLGSLIAAGMLMPSRLVRELGGYRPLFWEEFDLLLRLIESGRCTTAYVPRPLYAYTVEGGGMTSDERALREGWRELRELWPADVLARHGLGSYEFGVPGREAQR